MIVEGSDGSWPHATLVKYLSFVLDWVYVCLYQYSHSAVGAARPHRVDKLVVRNDTVSIEVHLSGDVVRLVVRDEMALTLHHVADLVLAHDAIAVEVHGAEGLVRVEVRVAGELLPGRLRLPLCADHRAHQVFESLAGTVGENIVLSIHIDSPVSAWSSRKHLRVVRVIWGQRGSELSVVEATITIFIVTLHEKLNVIRGHMHTNILEAMLDV